MKKLLFPLVLLVAPFVALRAEVSVIPHPLSLQKTAGKTVPFNATASIVCADPALAQIAGQTIATFSGLRLETGTQPAPGGPAITLDSADTDEAVAALGPEGYTLEVSSSGAVTIRSSASAGTFYGVQTLVQLLQNNGTGDWRLPVVKIEDKPRFGWRGIMLDEGRHFFGKDAVKRLLNVMALHKFNTLHWHLTEDQGWRIEIKKYPKLTSVGAWRAESPVPGNRNQGDGKRYGGFYTQDDIREIVAYAAARHITIVPEIEIPGHSAAALAAYPEFGNTDIPNYAPKVITRWGVHPYIYAPKEETFQFLQDIFDEVCELFPSPYIHIGGDEAPKTQWNQSAFAREVMARNKLKDAHALQSWFIQRIEKHLNAKGRKIIGWDEIQEGGLSPTATMMVWRDWKWARHALDRGNNIVMTPTSHCYLDYGQGKRPSDPIYEVIGGNLSLEKVYRFEPVPNGTAPQREKQVLGCQANCWAEYFFNWSKAEYMIFPRALAMAEVGWSAREVRNWESFQQRLPDALKRLDLLKVNYRKDDGTAAIPLEIKN